ncbi:MAG TPA: hypothetical protein VIM11_03490 [Tepidisphaeraceae bacterium]|jgi:ribosomal protein L31
MLRPNRRIVFAAASAISLLICLASLGVWVHSTQKMDRFRSTTPARRFTLHCKDGVIYIDVTTVDHPVWTPGYQHIHSLPTQFRPPQPKWEIGGFGFGSDWPEMRDVGVVHRQFIQIPLWPIVVLSSILPVLWFDARSRRSIRDPMALKTPIPEVGSRIAGPRWPA